MRPSLRLLTLVMLGLPAWGAVRAQVALLDPITRAQGSPSDYIFDLLQDRAGFIWMATDAGVVRYDGRDFVTWTTAEGLPHNYVYTLHELPDGALWIGTYSGVARLEQGRLRPIPGFRAAVHSIAHDRFGRVFLGGGADGVWVWERERLRRLVAEAPAQESHFVERSDGALTYPVASGRVLVLRPTQEAITVEWSQTPLPAEHRLVGLTPDGHYLLRAPTSMGVVWDADRRRSQHRLSFSPVRSMLALPGDGVLLGTEAGEVWQVSRSGRRKIVEQGAVNGYAVTAMMRDYEGHIWLGLFGGGVRRIAGAHLKLPSQTDSRLGRPILRLSRDRGGTVWVTTRDALLARTPAGAVREYWAARPIGLAADYPGGGHYMSTGTSLYRVFPYARQRPVSLFVEGNWISSMLLAAGDTLWLGSYGSGIRRLVGEREVAPPAAGAPSVVEALVAGSGGAVWALTRSEGAFRYDRGRWTQLREGLPSASVFSLLEEADGTVWLGTDRGLVRRRGARTQVFHDEGRLSGQRVHAVFRTRDTLWAVADRSLYALVRDTLRPLGHVRLRPDEASAIHAALPLPDAHRLLLGTSSGLVEIDLRELGSPLPAPRVAFLGIPGTPASARDTLRLSPGQRDVALAFAPLTFGTGEGRLQHRIGEGAWSLPTTDRTLTLAGLGDGRHVLEVRAVNADGRASVRPVRVVLLVPPPWWRTRLAQLLGLVGLVAAVALTARAISTRRLRRRLRALETERRVQAERDRISRDLHDHVGAQLSGVLAGLELLEGAPATSNGLLMALQREVRETMSALRTTIFTLQHPPGSFEELGRLLERYVRDQARFR
ncbi:MAG TPA: two-component regulator propeller domain-containing protein, partial [Rhodothermales bacterium]|nr:two-component regulator propeller domain-containing protein [Rhodothermales bacterium]